MPASTALNCASVPCAHPAFSVCSTSFVLRPTSLPPPQITFWIQNELLDAFAQQNFRDFLKHYAASARTVTEASHKTFNEFGIRLLDVQLIHFACADPETQKLLDKDIITRVTKQNELLAKEADVDIMKREKEVQMQKMDIEFEKSIKENSMQLKRKELDVSLRMKEVDLQIQEEKKVRTTSKDPREHACRRHDTRGAQLHFAVLCDGSPVFASECIPAHLRSLCVLNSAFFLPPAHRAHGNQEDQHREGRWLRR